ncbi:MAG: hypothetical protein ACW968_01325 [Candidatus Thorarchaeota archaeon]|jgi:hypothetical protein
MSFRVVDTTEVPESERVTTDRPDYTMEQVPISVSIQQERAAAVINSSTTPIESGSSNAYATGWLTTGDYNKLVGTLFANAVCTIYLEQSNDGETLHSQQTQSYTSGAYDGVFSWEITAPYVRLRVIATTNTTTFNVWSRLSSGA